MSCSAGGVAYCVSAIVTSRGWVVNVVISVEFGDFGVPSISRQWSAMLVVYLEVSTRCCGFVKNTASIVAFNILASDST
jgi:hypothetical protein